ncbi:cation transporter protein, putative [Trypanosoma brucei gambiense DAL972]|uniref:Cation transporter protein, putative n=2 Tax=Trypanosoma brucei TaxID=5691 RepID=D0A5Y6_TRYB9|nr:cation transporter protein, putative [Trypanosoma brucei gambiense DAL972]RHW67780.1 cation transporter protein [Trypanosoma brucei equiperdum]CBH17087.1 cation transporter protein, putative [Trypanosoma brucei gambiense DAL972]|eukprot:XP_011779351.1 cation transporter protein, putative [Trypanosoma brucei gambiense DAL972]
MLPGFPYKGNDISVANAISQLFSSRRERNLAMFLLLTTGVMVLELVYGIAVNSLGLISDAFHMMLDSASIAIGLCAAVVASFPSDERRYPFGYARYEVLGGFVNAVLLLFIAWYVTLESIERIIKPPEIEAGYLIQVSLIGLIVNILGIIFFHGMHGHSHAHGGCSGSVDHNIRGVYLHILADLLGSISVMTSSIIITLTGARISDPICSILCSFFIAASAFPLLEETGKVLLLSNQPYGELSFFRTLISEICSVVGVKRVLCLCAWTHSTSPRDSSLCAVKLLKHDSVDQSSVRGLVKGSIRSFITSATGVRNTGIIVHVE